MLNKLRVNIEHPEVLEGLYNSDKKAFEKAFRSVYSEIENTPFAKFWKARIDFNNVENKSLFSAHKDLFVLVISCIVAGILIKIPAIFSLDIEDYFYYQKNGGIILFFGLSLYTIWTNKKLRPIELILTFSIFILSALYINYLPFKPDSQSINITYIHVPLFIWCVYGLVYIEFDIYDLSKRINFIKHNGDLAVLGSILLLAGMILTGITIGLFSAIDIRIEDFYIEYIGIWGLVSAPIVASFIIKIYPVLTNKVAPVIANIFNPLVLITLIIYLITIPFSGRDLYNDREFLLIFNIMLLSVMGIIVFSISETSVNKKRKYTELMLLALTAVTLIIDFIALTAIFYRLGEFGISPNRIAVLGSNLLIFGNLIWILTDLIKINFKNSDETIVEQTVAIYLPVYAAWTLVVTFGFPLLFKMN
ncbi:MAG: hypothetical protein JW894_13695 [Bacteroidales bacterium]|nr:hypothetical protein [Bacteroidales bacterium]